MPSLVFDTKPLGFDDFGEDEKPDGLWPKNFAILRNYLQPDSTLTIDDAVSRAAEIFSDDRELKIAIIDLAIELSEQIPFDNPAHTKLAQLIFAFGDSDKWHGHSPWKDDPKKARSCFYERLNIYLYDGMTDPEDASTIYNVDPMMEVNIRAFIANLVSLDSAMMDRVYYGGWFHRIAMGTAFDDTLMGKEPRVRDAIMMCAAQNVTWSAARLFSMINKPGDAELNQVRAEIRAIETENSWPSMLRWSLTTQEEKEKQIQQTIQKKVDDRWPHTWEQWQKWKAGFRAAADDPLFGSACRDLARKAADLMDQQEKEWTEKNERSS